MRPSAQVICDSISPQGRRLTSIEAIMHRFGLAELNTHRLISKDGHWEEFSRNSASSRAIPFRVQVERVQENCAVPVSFPLEQRGMQGGEELEDRSRQMAESEWLAASQSAVAHAETLARLGVHKSVTNRLLEPFMWHTVILTATDWGNFFRQRCSPLAQPEIRAVAEAIQTAYDASTPDRLMPGDWHLPYITSADIEEAAAQGFDIREVSAARCARVSYLTHHGIRDLAEDVLLYKRLTSADPPHMSPLEHVATPCDEFEASGANFRGWSQLRTRVWGVSL